jgi:hypothetical protein
MSIGVHYGSTRAVITDLSTPMPRRSTYIPPRETLLNGIPWATVPTKAPLEKVKQWLADGLDLGVLTVDQVDLAKDDTAFLFISAATGERVVNFDSLAD